MRPGEVCAVNIGARGIRRRRLGGVIALVAGAALVAALVGFGLPPVARLLAFVPFLLGALGIYQAQEKT